MKAFKKTLVLSVCALFAAVVSSGAASAQSRDRVVRPVSSQPTNLPPSTQSTETVRTTGSSRPVLTNDIRVQRDAAWEPPVEKTASVSATGIGAIIAAGKTLYGASTSTKLDQAVRERYGIRYRYGATGPNAYDCSGFVWAAFKDAGIHFTRGSARGLWADSDPVEGDEKFKFGTLVFLNGLGHVGIVADENGFYHASSSKGITYSPFKGYWANRIVGFRKLRPAAPVVEDAK